MDFRRKLFHDIPPWVSDDAVFFVTICCHEKMVNTIANERVATVVAESLLFYQNQKKWWVHLWLNMPDHVHGLLSLHKETDFTKIIASWKRFVARKAGFKWQLDFFDHRIRSDESLEEKENYILNNPVRAGLVAEQREWPYVWVNGIRRN